MTARIELVNTSGIFSIDGEDFEVENNIWLVGDDHEVIVVDAAHDAAPIAAAIGDRTVKAILCTHAHDDHTQIDVVENFRKTKIIPGWKGKGKSTTWNIVDEKYKDFHIRSVGSYHDDVQGMMRGKNTILILEVDGLRIVHLGDLGHILSPRQVKAIGKVDVLMIPVGGIYTLNGSEAQQVVKQLKPKEYILPMHYGNIRYEDLLTVDEFLDGAPAGSVALSKNGGLVHDKEGKDHARFVRAGRD